DRHKWEAIACCRLKFAHMITRCTIAKECKNASRMACCSSTEGHWDASPDSAEPAIPKHPIGDVAQPQPNPLAKLATIKDDHIIRLKHLAHKSRHLQRMDP